MLPPTRPTAVITTSFPPPSNLWFYFAAAAALSFLVLLKPPHLLPLLRPPLCLRLRFPVRLRRRRLETSAMRRPAAPLAFSSPDSLSEWLKPRLPSDAFASWGVAPGTKTLHNLWLELSHGETSLLLSDEEGSSSLPLRAVNVATVRVRNARGALLVESQQLLSDGTVRPRHRPLSEKMRPGESIEEAAVRAVKEELGKESVKILPGSYEIREEERASASYPGLPAWYVLHSVEAEVEGLPEEGEFSTEEMGEAVEARENAVFVRRHFWKWVDDDGSI